MSSSLETRQNFYLGSNCSRAIHAEDSHLRQLSPSHYLFNVALNIYSKASLYSYIFKFDIETDLVIKIN